MSGPRDVFGAFGTRLNLAKVTAYDFKLNELGQPLEDEFGNAVPSGLLTIELLDRGGARDKVPFSLPLVGNTVFIGGLPEIGTLCVVGWRQQNLPVIIGFIPLGFAELVTGRGTLPNLEAGEVLLQSSKHDVDSAGQTNFFVGARVWLDRYGRIRLSCQDYELITGYILSGEFTPEVSVMNDPVTGEPVFLRERIAGGTERRVDNKGSTVWTYGKDKHERVGGNVNVQVTGQVDQQVNKGQRYYDDRGNTIEIKEDGTIELKSVSGAFVTFTQGSATHQVAGFEDRQVQLSLNTTVGENYLLTIGGNLEIAVVGTETKSFLGGDSTEEIATGMKKIIAQTGILLETIGELAPIRVGSEDADEPLVLGQILLNAVESLIKAFTNTPVGFGNLGAPVPWNPAILAALETFKQQFLANPDTNIVSQKCFTERK